VIPRGTVAQDVNVNHLHINTGYILEDINVMLPLARMAEFEHEGIIGRLADTSYSFYGFSGKTPNSSKRRLRRWRAAWKRRGSARPAYTGLTLLLPVRGTGRALPRRKGFLHGRTHPDPRFPQGRGHSPLCRHRVSLWAPGGRGGDQEGQRRVLLAALAVLRNLASRARCIIFHSPGLRIQRDPLAPPEMSPLIKTYLHEIKAARR